LVKKIQTIKIGPNKLIKRNIHIKIGTKFMIKNTHKNSNSTEDMHITTYFKKKWLKCSFTPPILKSGILPPVFYNSLPPFIHYKKIWD
jgi:hypothetical protein